MPIPINLNNSNSDGNHYVDYSFLENLGLESSFTPAPAAPKNVVTASNQDAASLYKLWERSDNSLAGEFDLNKIKESTDLSARDITRLKTMGFISESSNKVKITERSRKVLVTMTLSEPNNFQLKAQKKPYNEILAGMDRKKKGGLRCASYATNNNNCLDLRGKTTNSKITKQAFIYDVNTNYREESPDTGEVFEGVSLPSKNDEKGYLVDTIEEAMKSISKEISLEDEVIIDGNKINIEELLKEKDFYDKSNPVLEALGNIMLYEKLPFDITHSVSGDIIIPKHKEITNKDLIVLLKHWPEVALPAGPLKVRLHEIIKG